MGEEEHIVPGASHAQQSDASDGRGSTVENRRDRETGHGSVTTGSAEKERMLTELQDAQLIPPDADADVENLMVQAYLASGGLPSRYVQAGEAVTPLPDMTTSGHGEEVLEGLRNQILSALPNHREGSPPTP